jgi:hypothetical protein
MGKKVCSLACRGILASVGLVIVAMIVDSRLEDGLVLSSIVVLVAVEVYAIFVGLRYWRDAWSKLGVSIAVIALLIVAANYFLWVSVGRIIY